MTNLRAGRLTFQKNGTAFDAVGDFTYNLGADMRTGLVGPSGVQGFSEMPQIPFIQGALRDFSDMDLKNDILNFKDGTITLALANGKTIMLEEAYFCLEGDVTTEEASIAVKFEGTSAEEV